MPEKVAFRTKPQLARRMLERAVESGVPFGWATGDEVYGNDRNLRLWLERRDIPHVLAIKSNEKLWAWTDKGPRQVRADRLASGVEESGWVRLSAGDGAKGPRVYDWALVDIRPLREPGKGYWLLARRSVAKPEELATTCATARREQPWRNWCGWPGPGGPLRNALRRPRDRACPREGGGGTGPIRGAPVVRLVPAHHPRVVARGRLWRCWPTPTWRWYGIRHRRRDVWEKRGLPQFGRKADTADGARGSAVTLPADMETPP